MAGSPSGSVSVTSRISNGTPVDSAETLGHRLVVEVAPGARYREEADPALHDHGSHLTLAVDRDERKLGGAEAGQREREHDRLDTGRQLPGERSLGVDPEVNQPRGDPLAPVTELTEAHSAVVLVDQHRCVG